VAVRWRRSVAVVLIVIAAGLAGLLLWRARPLSPTAVALRAELPGLIQADMNLLDLPAGAAAQRQALDADERGTLRESVLRVWDFDAADGRVNDVAASRKIMVRDRLDVYDGVRVNVDSWDDISASGNAAHVLVTLRSSVHRASTGVWDQPKRDQWEFRLRKQTDGTWKINSERVTAYLSGQN
jgi:hypothetical protein